MLTKHILVLRSGMVFARRFRGVCSSQLLSWGRMTSFVMCWLIRATLVNPHIGFRRLARVQSSVVHRVLLSVLELSLALNSSDERLFMACLNIFPPRMAKAARDFQEANRKSTAYKSTETPKQQRWFSELPCRSESLIELTQILERLAALC